MRNKKGFTLVELVIVIAVIAILAGVMIGTFASVVKKAKKSAEQQEMAAAKQEQTANDVIEKLNNGSWLGWTDFEEKLAKALADVNVTGQGELTEASIKAAVAAALNEYAAAHPDTDKTNTGLTEQQVKYIIENALSGQLTAEQVKAIVNNAVSSTSTLTKSQVQAIVDAAVGKTITPSQVKEVVDEVIKANKVSTLTVADVEEKINSILNSKNYSTLTEKEVEKIISELLKNYSVKSADVTDMKGIKDLLNDDKVTNPVVKLSENYKVVSSDIVETVEIKNNKGEKTGEYYVSLKISKDTVIDLGDKKLDLGNTRVVVEKGATLTIKGSGEIVSADRAIANNGNLVIENANVKAGVGSVAAISNFDGGFMTINGGNYSGTDAAVTYIVSAFGNSTTVINGGTFTGPAPVGLNGADSKNASLIINAGTFNGTTADDCTVFLPAGKVSIYGGTFTSKGGTVLGICGGDISVYAGTFTSTGAGSQLGSQGSFADGNAICIIKNRSSGYKFDKVFVSANAKITPAAGSNAIKTYAGTGNSNQWGDEVTADTYATVTADVTITK